jgi:dTDP-4-dehydrorhamnose 3,5-epimerase
MIFSETSLPGVIRMEPAVFGDSRGFFMEIYHRERYRAGGIGCAFMQDNYSHSQKNILRGLHYQLNKPQDKLIFVMAGEIFDVAVDIRKGSPAFGRWFGTHLSSANKHQLFIPRGFAHGFCVLSETADVFYKCSELYDPDDDYGILWSDPSIGIQWPLSDPVLSPKDQQNAPLSEIPENRLPRYGLG